MEPTPTIAVVGNFVVDMIVHPVSELPLPGELMLVDAIDVAGGGAGFTTSVALARLGAHVLAVGAVGRDSHGAQMRGWLAGEGVELAHLADVAASTSATVVVVSAEGERSYIHAPGASNAMRVDLSVLDTPSLTAVHVGAALIMGGLDDDGGCVRLLRAARARGIRTSLDTSWDGSGRWHRVLPYLAHLDVFCPSLVEAQQISGHASAEDVASWALAQGVGSAVIHAGGEGAFVASDPFTGWMPAFAVEVVDTTGAGETFDAGLVYGLSVGLSLEQATRLACAAGALATTRRGAIGGLLGLEPALALAQL